MRSLLLATWSFTGDGALANTTRPTSLLGASSPKGASASPWMSRGLALKRFPEAGVFGTSSCSVGTPGLPLPRPWPASSAPRPEASSASAAPRRRKTGRSPAPRPGAPRVGQRARAGFLTECEQSAVSEGTQRLYDHHVSLFGRWVAKRPSDLDLDTDLVDYLDTLLMDGCPSGDGEKAVAAVIAASPGVDRRKLLRTIRALRGFRKRRPPRSRLPILEEVMAGIVAFLWNRGEQVLALFVMTLFYGYFRPGEGRSFFCADLNLPAGGLQESLNCVSLTVAPETRLEWSKTQTFDDTVLLDAPVRYSGQLLATLRHAGRRRAPLLAGADGSRELGAGLPSARAPRPGALPAEAWRSERRPPRAPPESSGDPGARALAVGEELATVREERPSPDSAEQACPPRPRVHQDRTARPGADRDRAPRARAPSGLPPGGEVTAAGRAAAALPGEPARNGHGFVHALPEPRRPLCRQRFVEAFAGTCGMAQATYDLSRRAGRVLRNRAELPGGSVVSVPRASFA